MLFAALLTGAGVAALRAQTHPVFYTKAALGAALKLPVIGRVSQAYSISELAAHTRGSLAYGSAVVLLLALVIMLALFEFSASQFMQHLVSKGVG